MGLFDSLNLNREVFPCFFCYNPVDPKYHYSIKLMKEDDENLNIYGDKIETSPEGMRFMPYENSTLPKKILRLDVMEKRDENFARIGVTELKHHEECMDFGALFKKYPEYVIVATNLRADSKELEKRKAKQEKKKS